MTVATLGTGVAASVAMVAAATAANTAIQTGMNAEGDIFKRIKDTTNTSWQATTSEEAMKSYLVAAGTAFITAGLTSGSEGVIAAGNAPGATLLERAAGSLAESTISNVSSTAAQSAVNGESFTEAMRGQAEAILIGAAGNMGAKQIGNAFKIGNLTKTEQLALHGVLGCGMAASGGGDCASGAVSGITGELAGDVLRDSGIDKQIGAQLAGMIGSYS